MNASEYIEKAITEATKREDGSTLPVFGTRFPTKEASEGPSVVWRMVSSLRSAGIDGPLPATVRFFEIECRSPVREKSEIISGDILANLECGGCLTHIISEYDKPDDFSQEVAEYYSHVIVVGISADHMGVV